MTIDDSGSTPSRPDKIGPYRIEHRLGSGGMGAVYRAHDERLGRDVALKQLLPEIADDRHARGRFLREARAVARLNHPNIVQIHDVVEADGQDWIVLELAQGKTIAEHMAGDKLPLPEVLTLAYGMAKGLAAAHAEGIVHRDLKAKNVIVNDDGRVKILDFGLAKQLKLREGDVSLSATGGLMGTPQAMSPEQVLNKTVDHRSDLFSLGSLLYEMVTGTSPFRGSTPVETMKQVYDHPHTPAEDLEPDIPEEVAALIDQLLAKDPEERPQSAEQVAVVLRELVLQYDGSTASLSGWSSSRSDSQQLVEVPDTVDPDQLSPRRWVAWLALALAVVGLVVGFRWWRPNPLGVSEAPDADRPAIAERQRILVGRLDNQTGEATLDEALNLAFRIGLEQSRHALLLPDSQIRQALERMHRDPETTIVDREIGVEVCKREGAKALVTGSIVKIGNSYQLNANIVDPWTEISTFSAAVIAEGQDSLVSALDELTREIRRQLGESLASVEATVQLEKVTTPDFEALRSYSAGVRKRAEEAVSEARQLFRRAIEKDPDFAMAHAQLARIYIDRDRNYTEALRYLDRALEPDRLTGFEELYVKGWLARLRGTPQDVVDAWSSMSSLYPDRSIGHHNVAMAYLFLFNRADKAAANFQKGLAVEPDPAERRAMQINLGHCLLAAGRSDEALRSFQALGSPWHQMVFYHLVVEENQQARALLDKQLTVSQPTDRLLESSLRMLYYTSQGDFEQAESLAATIRRLARESGSARDELAGFLVAAALLERTGSRGEFRQALGSGFEIVERLLATELRADRQQTATLAGIHHLPMQLFVYLGKLGARDTRDQDSAFDDAVRLQGKIQALTERRRLPFWGSLSKMLESEILAARGDNQAAIVRLLEAQTSADSFMIHESLARLHRAAGHTAQAIAEYEWLIANRGKALTECFEGCQAAVVLDLHLAFYHLGRLHEESGEPQKAMRHYRQFVDRWPTAESLPEWQAARQRLVELEGDVPPEAPSD